MKPILSIIEKKFAILPVATSSSEQRTRDYVTMSVSMIPDYDREWSVLGGFVAQRSISCNVSYVNALFIAVSYLNQYYEFSQRHFDLLGSAAKNIERLYNEKIQELMSNPEAVTETRKQLAVCLEKVTLIFQTAADKTEDKECAFAYEFNATQYSEKANMYSGVGYRESYIATIQRLYQKYSEEPLIGEFLRSSAQEYKEKLEKETAQHSAPRSASSSFSSHASSVPPSPLFFTSATSSAEQQPLLTQRNAVSGSDSLILDS